MIDIGYILQFAILVIISANFEKRQYMAKLQIFSTARAIRKKIKEYKEKDSLLPRLMRIDDFEKSIAVVPNLSLINSTQRVLYLKEAANFKEFEKLKSQRELIKFFSQSEDFFKFFEELSWETVELEDLIKADSYAEFEEHILILSKLQNNYQELLKQNGFTDRMFIPKNYQLNLGFIENFDEFEIFIDGYLSRFELKLLKEVAKYKRFLIHIRTTKYNQKMVERFKELGVNLPQDSKVVFDLSTKEILSSTKMPLKIDAKVYSLQNRFEQIAAIFGEVEKMVQSGVSPEDIAVVLPDESFASSIALYDKLNNYNFAMGFSFTHSLIFRKLKAVSNYLKSFENIEDLKFFGIDIQKLSLINSSLIAISEFFEILSQLVENHIKSLEEAINLINQNSKNQLAKLFLSFYRLFLDLKLPFKEWLYLWLRELENLRIDDTSGGKVTVMGLLETRGVEFEGVVICDFNEGLVPAVSSKDRFLNSTVRKFASLPTKEDRDSLQRYYYTSLMEKTKNVVILYSTSNDMIASKFIYELNLPKPKEIKPSLNSLYKPSKKTLTIEDVEVEFKAKESTWSATKLDIWLSCKRKFYYQYILKIEPKPKKEINVGAVLHSSLKRLFQQKREILSKEEFKQDMLDMLSFYESSKDIATFNYYKRVWIKAMDRFFSNQVEHFKRGWRVLDCEKEVNGEIEGIKFSGKIDRIDILDKRATLIDYKSGAIKNSKNLENLSDFQMNIYYLLFKDFEIEDLVFWELFDRGEAISLVEFEKRSELLISNLKSLKETKSFVAKRCDDLNRCRFCEYRVICQRGEFI